VAALRSDFIATTRNRNLACDAAWFSRQTSGRGRLEGLRFTSELTIDQVPACRDRVFDRKGNNLIFVKFVWQWSRAMTNEELTIKAERALVAVGLGTATFIMCVSLLILR